MSAGGRRRGATPPRPPDALGPAARKRWTAVLPDLLRHGEVDLELLETYCQVYGRWRKAEDQLAESGSLVRSAAGRAVANPYISISAASERQMRQLEKRLGIAAEPTASSDDDGVLFTRRELARTLDVHMQTISSKWEPAGMPVAQRGGRGRPSLYRLSDVRAWLDRRTAEAAASTNGHGRLDLVQERAELARAQAERVKLETLARRGELADKRAVERVWAAEVAAVRTRLLALPVVEADRIARAAVVDGVPGVEAVLEAIVRDVLTELARPDAVKHQAVDSSPLDSSSPPSEPPPAPRRGRAKKPRKAPRSRT